MGETDKAQTFLHKTFSITLTWKYITSKTSSYSDIPDNAVTIEHLEWQPHLKPICRKQRFLRQRIYQGTESASSSFLQSDINPVSDSTEQSVIATNQGEIISQDPFPNGSVQYQHQKPKQFHNPNQVHQRSISASENVFLQDDSDARSSRTASSQLQKNKIAMLES
jgi:hypothetical protein